MAKTRDPSFQETHDLGEKLLDFLSLNMQNRMAMNAYGEVTIKVLWEAGKIKTIRVLEEQIIKDGEDFRKRG